jgi:hypothetical protein
VAETYPTFKPPRKYPIFVVREDEDVDPSEKRPYNGPKFSLPTQGGDSYAGPRFDPRAVSSGRYTGPQFSVSRRDADTQDGAYTGPKLVVNRTERSADADRVADDQRRYPVYTPPAAQTASQQYPTYKAPPDSSVTAGPAGDDLYPRSKVTGPDGYTGPKGPAMPQPSATEQDAARLRDLLANPPANANSRGAGALRLMAFDAVNQARETDSLGRTAGAALGGLFSGLINKRADEEVIDRPAELARAQAQLGADAAADKEALARREAEARIDEQNALAEMHRRPPRPPKPQYVRDGRGRIFVVDSENPSQAQAVTDESGKILDPRFERPFNIPLVDSNGINVGLAQYDQATDSYKQVTVDGKPVVTKQVQPVITEGPNSGMTPAQARGDEERDADRASRERTASANRATRESVARLVTSSRERIASVNQEMQRDRQRLREAAFKIQYPGYGKTLTHDDIVKKYEEFKQTRPNLTLKETVQAVIDQGYTVRP